MNINNSRLIDFHLNLGPDSSGRSLLHILYFSNTDLEFTHDYIQWLFPLPEPSGYIKNCPVMDEDVLDRFKNSDELKDSLISCLKLMKSFYKNDYGWTSKNNHNHLRISRIIRCLALVGLSQEANDFYRFILKLAIERNAEISETTLKYWEAASKGILFGLN
ncbi:MAG TPA: opioid growth factor receptor-related protein [Candidatus Glassbacteria bacterium]|nr:opioid growth factor receptor-related protein [Candidatus Glassbacteria bacterium]